MTARTALAADYDAVRPPFAETGTPRLPIGLNLGAQLFWQAERFPDEFAKVATILIYPQYWAFRLSGVAANEATSLGCHTDLWNPAHGRFFDAWSIAHGLAASCWRRCGTAGDRLGPVLPELAAANRARSATRRCSAASTIPTPRSTASAAAAGALLGRLDRHLGHLDGGRRRAGKARSGARLRWSMSTRSAIPCPRRASWAGANFRRWSEPGVEDCADADVARVLDGGVMLLPSVQAGSGPFPDRGPSWVGDAADRSTPAALCRRLALSRHDDGDLPRADRRGRPGHRRGAFREKPRLRRDAGGCDGHAQVLAAAGSATGTSIGAALLAAAGIKPQTSLLPRFRRRPALGRPAFDALFQGMAARRLA